jgi:hypothetical protein
MSLKTWLAGGVAAIVFALAGCGTGKKKDTAPTEMMPLPPPPTAAGAGGPPPKAKGDAQQPAKGGDQPADHPK